MRFDKVQRGQRVRMRADTWNALMRMLAEWQGRSGGAGGLTLPMAGDPDFVIVKNASGGDVPQFGVLGVDNVVFAPADAEAEFRSNPTVVGIVPTDADHLSRFLVCIEPIADGKFGKAILSGLTVVRVTVSDEDHGYADVNDGDVTMLESCDRGAAQVLWKETGTGTKWAVARLGVPPAPFEVVGFSGVCRVDELNPDTKYPGDNSAFNEADAFGNPKPGEREWLLLKCERPFLSDSDTEPGQEAHFPIELTVAMSNATKYWWEYYLITEDFFVADDAGADPPEACATWNTMPNPLTKQVLGTDGLIVSSVALTGSLDTSDRHLSSCLPGFQHEVLVYGVCLRPYLWYLGGVGATSTHEVDSRKWHVRL